MSDLDYQYLITVEKLDEILNKKNKKLESDLSSKNDYLRDIHKNFSKSKKNKHSKRKKDILSKEDELFQDIYIKFDGDYAELVDDYVQTLVKFENKKVKFAYIFGFAFCIFSLSLAFIFSIITGV